MKTHILFGLLLISAVFISAPGVASAHGADLGCIALKKTLAVGARDASTGGAVTSLQTFLHVKGYLASEPTGYFGPMTFKAVQEFQKSQKFEAVGIAGPMTRAAIEKISCAKQATLPVAPNGTAGQVAGVAEAVASAPAGNTSVALPYRTKMLSNWKGTWGAVSNSNTGTLLVNAAPTTNGAEAIFEGGKDWTDYRYTASVFVSNGDITLIGRYVDKDNFLACTFFRNEIAIKERVNGETTTRAIVSVPEVMSATYFNYNTSISMRVKGNTIGCSNIGVNDNVFFDNVNPKLQKGTIGIQTFSVATGASTLELKEVNIEIAK